MNKEAIYAGTKLIYATPMNRKEYNNYRNWELPADEEGEDEGYLIEYPDGGTSNHLNHKGYISWSPKYVFDREYGKSGKMDFGAAVKLLKEGYRVSRAGWNGKGMHLVYVAGTDYQLNTIAREKLVGDRQLPWVGMKTANEEFVPWLASQTDILSEDWGIAN